MNDKMGQKTDVYARRSQQGYALLAANVLTTDALISQNTVASATVVILKQMKLNENQPRTTEPENIAKDSQEIGGVNAITGP